MQIACLQNVCACLMEGKKYTNCETYISQFLSLKEKILQDDNHPQLIPIYEVLGHVYLEQVGITIGSC